MNLIFIATGDIALPTFRHLLTSGPKPTLLITQPDKPTGRHQTLTPHPIKTLALQADIPVWQPEKINHIADDLAALSPDIIVVMAYGQMIGKKIRQTPTNSIINLHASLLPKYRGAACIQAAIDNGDTHTGITIMRVTRQLDAGDIISRKTIPITQDETAATLHDKLAELGPAALTEAIEILTHNPTAGTPQNHPQATHIPKLLREHGQLDWNQPAPTLERRIRAYHPWPGTYTTFTENGKNKRLKIFPTTTTTTEIQLPPGHLLYQNQQLHIGTAQGTLIPTLLQPEGSKPMTASDFHNRRGGGLHPPCHLLQP